MLLAIRTTGIPAMVFWNGNNGNNWKVTRLSKEIGRRIHPSGHYCTLVNNNVEELTRECYAMQESNRQESKKRILLVGAVLWIYLNNCLT